MLVGLSASLALPGALPTIASLRGYVADELRLVLTPSATNVLDPSVVASATQSPTYVHGWREDGYTPHTELTSWAQSFVVFPCTAHTIAKASHGYAPDLLSLCFLNWTGPILFLSVMSDKMSTNEAVLANVETLRNRGHQVEIISTGNSSVKNPTVVTQTSPYDIRRLVGAFTTSNGKG